MSKFTRNQATPSPYATTAPNEPVATNRPHFGKALLEGADRELLALLPESKVTDLHKVLGFIDREYGSRTLADYLYVGTEGNETGRVCGTIPKDEFFGDNPGHFQLRLSWPEIIDGRLSAKLSINYRIESDFNNTVLEPGGGTGDPAGWTNLNTAQVFVDEAVAKGFFAPGAIVDILKFCQEKCGAREKATLTLTPQSEVYIQLRNTIVPLKTRATGRKIVSSKQAGADAGLGISNILFSGATVLPRLSPLMGAPTGSAPLTYSELMASYGMGATVPVAHWGNADTSAPVESEV